MSEKKLLDETDLNVEYTLSKPWLRKHRLLRDGPPFLRIGRMIRYERKSVEKWLAERAVETEKGGGQ